MERHRDQDFEQIRQSLLRMGGLVERMISEAGFTLLERTHDGVYATYLAEAPG